MLESLIAATTQLFEYYVGDFSVTKFMLVYWILQFTNGVQILILYKLNGVECML